MDHCNPSPESSAPVYIIENDSSVKTYLLKSEEDYFYADLESKIFHPTKQS